MLLLMSNFNNVHYLVFFKFLFQVVRTTTPRPIPTPGPMDFPRPPPRRPRPPPTIPTHPPFITHPPSHYETGTYVLNQIHDSSTEKEKLCNKYKNSKLIPKGGIMSEDNGAFLPLPKNIPKNYLKLSYPVHGHDKLLVKFNRLHV